MVQTEHTTDHASDASASELRKRAKDLVQQLYEADYALGYSIDLVRMLDGVSTYRLAIEDEKPSEHGSYSEASGRLRAFRAARRVEAAIRFLAHGPQGQDASEGDSPRDEPQESETP